MSLLNTFLSATSAAATAFVIIIWHLGWTSPGTITRWLAAQCDQDKVARERVYDCHATLNAVLHYRDGSYTIEWEEVVPEKK